MSITPNQAKKILEGNHTFSQLGFSLLITRLKNNYKKEPTQVVLKKCTDEMNAYVEKFKVNMEKDLANVLKS